MENRNSKIMSQLKTTKFLPALPLLSQALENEDFEGLADTRLEKNYVENEMFRMIEAASACVRHSAAKRPWMRQVVRAFDFLDELSDLSNGMKPGQIKTTVQVFLITLGVAGKVETLESTGTKPGVAGQNMISLSGCTFLYSFVI
ncbi:unnamed protein product [Prunus armeniaca]|uniref:non-specific serine/threonine protein kinase n=1 Tax=Prunus armeniaca TaxID=36596 RepID=A0A6J5WTR2_PRUAR|nr:unnamed protein product [Prunus armeniaca]